MTDEVYEQVTSYFVPVIVGIALLTLSFWIIRGATGTLPTRWYAQNGQDGKWGLFAVQFAVAVLGKYPPQTLNSCTDDLRT